MAADGCFIRPYHPISAIPGLRIHGTAPHKAGVLSWTLGYNAAVPLAALVDLPVMLLLGAFVTALGEAKERG